MTATLTDDDVARHLRAHPEFFAAHPELLASITVPHQHGGRAISLHERQLEVLREKNRALEMKLAELVRIGQENEAISERLQKWTRQLLLAADPERLPQAVAEGMQTIFSVPHVALRLWGVREPYRAMACATPVEVDVITLANSMKQPYCGPNADFQAATWLPEGGAATRSLALLALRKGVDPNAFGMLVLGSADPDRYQINMGTAFLDRITEIASAALSRLVD
ncbi:MAG TPA: DUF484 family protein [Quisquiliibacterium sp.]|nr:DUF484 family protein [Quisquiliibacterium sp.]